MLRIPPPWWVLECILIVVFPGCRPAEPRDQAGDIHLELQFDPQPPRVGPETVTIALTDPAGKPVSGAAVQLEGNMNHAGMTPVFAEATEKTPGSYEATLELTMGGDWFVLVHATLADGRKLQRKVDIRGVKSR